MKIGLEVHVALPTKSKLFCSCSMDDAEPNTNICPICTGFPGSKPMLNSAAAESGFSIANALHCKINRNMSFVRKVYFYPDLPKCYQITQMGGAVGSEGYLDIQGKRIGIRRVQIEEDPAQIVRDGMLTLLDFNRSGTPLVEIVTEPDITDEGELRSFIANLRSILYYLGVDINREIKADLNISISDVRVEVKNVTGIKSLIEAARYEIARQHRVLEEGKAIAKETRGYNEKRRIVFDAVRGRDDYDTTCAVQDIRDEKKKKLFVIEELNQYSDKRIHSHFERLLDTLGEKYEIATKSIGVLGSAVESYYIIAMAEASTNLAKYNGYKYGLQHIEPNARYNEFFTEARANFGVEAKRRIILRTFIRSSSACLSSIVISRIVFAFTSESSASCSAISFA